MSRKKLVAQGWRQFSVLHPKALNQGTHNLPTGSILVATNYDCAVVSDAKEESECEFIIAVPTESPDPNWRYSHNPRNLAFPVIVEAAEGYYCVQPNKKILVDKKLLLSTKPCNSTELPLTSQNELKYWLAQRYLSAALPEDLEVYLRSAKKVLNDELKKISRKPSLKELTEGLDIYIYYEEEAEEGFCYSVGYYLIAEASVLKEYQGKLSEFKSKLAATIDSTEGLICDQVRLDEPSGFSFEEMSVCKRLAYIDEYSFRSERS